MHFQLILTQRGLIRAWATEGSGSHSFQIKVGICIALVCIASSSWIEVFWEGIVWKMLHIFAVPVINAAHIPPGLSLFTVSITPL